METDVFIRYLMLSKFIYDAFIDSIGAFYVLIVIVLPSRIVPQSWRAPKQPESPPRAASTRSGFDPDSPTLGCKFGATWIRGKNEIIG